MSTDHLGTLLVPLQFEIARTSRRKRRETKELARRREGKQAVQEELFETSSESNENKSPLPQGSVFEFVGNSAIIRVRYTLIVEGYLVIRRMWELNEKTKRAVTVNGTAYGSVSRSFSMRLNVIAEDKLAKLDERIRKARMLTSTQPQLF